MERSAFSFQRLAVGFGQKMLVLGGGVKIGEDKSGFSAGLEKIFLGEKPGKDVHHVHRPLVGRAPHAPTGPKCA